MLAKALMIIAAYAIAHPDKAKVKGKDRIPPPTAHEVSEKILDLILPSSSLLKVLAK